MDFHILTGSSRTPAIETLPEPFLVDLTQNLMRNSRANAIGDDILARMNAVRHMETIVAGRRCSCRLKGEN